MKPNSRKFNFYLHESHGNAKSGKRTREYQIWVGMIARCYNEKHDSYSRYGGRGITVCDRWLNSFSSFLEDMGRSPSIEYTIDRKNNNGNYELNNCNWVDKKTQSKNKCNNIFITLNGQDVLLINISEQYNIPLYVLYNRIADGWSDEEVAYRPYKPYMDENIAKSIANDYLTKKFTIMNLAEIYEMPYSTIQAITKGKNFSSVTGIKLNKNRLKQKYVKLERTTELLEEIKEMLINKIPKFTIYKKFGISWTALENILKEYPDYFSNLSG